MTDGGRNIFEYELGQIQRKNIFSPFRTEKNAPSFRVKQSVNGSWIGIDYGGDNWTGNAIAFVQKRYGLTFSEAMSKIIQDLGLATKIKEYKPIIQNIKSTPIEKDIPYIEFDDIPFDKAHAAYWDKYYLPETFLRENNLFRVDKWAINKKVQPKTEGELTFGYWAEDIQRAKIMRIGPNVGKGDKWRSGMENSYLWNYYRYKNIPEKLSYMFTWKSQKDELVARYLNYHSISTQSENAKIMLIPELSNNVERINAITEHNIMGFGTDPQGKATSIEITKSTGWDWFNIDNHHYKNEDIEDPADFVEGYGLEALDYLLKIKLNGRV
jgi:hypothetical protein